MGAALKGKALHANPALPQQDPSSHVSLQQSEPREHEPPDGWHGSHILSAPQTNRAPSRLISSSTPSACGLITVTLHKSITSVWSFSDCFASSHDFFSSVTHGSISLPSRTNLRWRSVSMVVILSIVLLSLGKVQCGYQRRVALRSL